MRFDKVINEKNARTTVVVIETDVVARRSSFLSFFFSFFLSSYLAEVQVHEVVGLGGDEGTEMPPHDAVPLRSVQPVEVLFHRRRDILR